MAYMYTHTYTCTAMTYFVGLLHVCVCEREGKNLSIFIECLCDFIGYVIQNLKQI